MIYLPTGKCDSYTRMLQMNPPLDHRSFVSNSFPRNSSPLFFIFCSCYFSVLHVSVDINTKKVEKRLGFVVAFSLKKSGSHLLPKTRGCLKC